MVDDISNVDATNECTLAEWIPICVFDDGDVIQISPWDMSPIAIMVI